MKLFSYLSLIGFLLLVPASSLALLNMETEEFESPSVSQEFSSSGEFMTEEMWEEAQQERRCRGHYTLPTCVEPSDPDDSDYNPCCDPCLSFWQKLFKGPCTEPFAFLISP